MLTSFLSQFLIWPLRLFSDTLLFIGVVHTSLGCAVIALGLLIAAAYISYAVSHTVRVRK